MTNLYKFAMNRFLTKKKPRESEDAPAVPPVPKWGKKGKKGMPEQKPQLDLAAALPSNDEFRTSLLMPNLSARFSMLREQDDPNSKLGKASDDSVLLPNRQSRLMGYGARPGVLLADIAEVSSINSSIRPPFANERQHSFYSDGYATDDDASQQGSVMARARPGEGNILFGGRQRVYKIPMKGGMSGTRTMGGKAVYEDDVHMSAFQKLRLAEREQRRREMEEAELGLDLDLDSPRKNSFQSHTPSEYNRKRETSSSTNSGPPMSRTSTAATSIASQGANAVAPSGSSSTAGPPSGSLERSVTKARRLYEQNLDQNIQEQQTSVLTRLNSIQRQRTVNGRNAPTLSHTKSTGNLSDRYHRSRTAPFKSPSPPPSDPLRNPSVLALTKGEPSPLPSVPSVSQSVSPLSPFGSDQEESSTLASAVHPSDRGKATAMGAFNKPLAFDEKQYLERQKQMQEGRDTPPPRKSSSDTKDSSPEQSYANNGTARDEATNSNADKKLNSLDYTERQPKHIVSPADYDSDSDYGDDNGPKSPMPGASFTGLSRRSKVMSIVDYTTDPLNKESLEKIARADPSLSYIETINGSSDATATRKPQLARNVTDSPTLGPDSGGLNGLVRQHLRNTSMQSSIYVPSTTTSLVLPPIEGLHLRENGQNLDVNRVPSTYSHSNPFDLEELDDALRAEADGQELGEPVESKPVETSQDISLTPSVSQTQALQPSEKPPGTDDAMDWKRDLRKQHTRGGSAETQDEREAFANELLERQRAIQESLRSKSQKGSRNPSPSPAKRAFTMLRSKSSRDSMATRSDAASRSRRTLGIGAPSANASSASLAESIGKASRKVDESMIHPAERQNGQLTGGSKPDGQSVPSSAQSSVRTRSSSEVSGESQNRSRRMGRSRHVKDSPASAEPVSSHPTTTPRPSVDDHNERKPSPPPRSRSRGPPKPAGYFDQRSLKPIQTHDPVPTAPPWLSPAPSSSGVSPGASPASFSSSGAPPPPSSAGAFSTPPLSAATTPNGTGAPAGGPNPYTRGPAPRKKSIQKSDISEPTLIMRTSNVDVTDLPPGASLRNGQDEANAPPVPPINPRRRRFNWGRQTSQESSRSGSNTPTGEQGGEEQEKSFYRRLRKSSSEGKSLRGLARDYSAPPSPALPKNPEKFLISRPQPIN